MRGAEDLLYQLRFAFLVFETDEAIPDLSWETKATLSLDLDEMRLRYCAGTPADVRARGWEMI